MNEEGEIIEVPLREYKDVKKIIMSRGRAQIIGNPSGSEETNFITTAIHKRASPKTSITVERDRTVIEFGGVAVDGATKIDEMVVCRVWPRPYGLVIGCSKEVE